MSRDAGLSISVAAESGSLRRQDWTTWGMSFVAHAIVLAMLSLVYFDAAGQVEELITSVLDENQDPQQFRFESVVSDQIGTSGDLNSLADSSQMAAASVSVAPQQQMEEQLEESVRPPAPIVDSVLQPEAENLLATVSSTNGAGASANAGSVEGAIDRLTWEIANSLRENKTLVIWMLDVSPSLFKRRELIADRIDNVYNQLTKMNVSGDRALLSAIVTFGEKSTIATPEPIESAADVVAKIRGVESQSSGNENTFASAIAAMQKFQPLRRQGRNLMLIVVTDEAGSDSQNLEQAIQIAKRSGTKVYCVGDAAPFGRKTVEVPFTLDSGEEIIGKMDRGPETLFPERVQLPYFGVNDYDLNEMSSGFGPYALTRLCAESGGLFLVTDEGRGPRHDPQAMRGYMPDYRPIPVITREFQQNSAKATLVKLAETLQVENVPTPQLVFNASDDNILRQQITEAQKPMAEFDYKLEAIQRVLEAAEKDRAKISEPRLQAGFDLALGRVLALRVRGFGYNTMLAEMKASPKKFETAGSNQWRLVPSKDITSGANVKKLATKATELLKRVIDSHSNTPWEKFAARELSQPLGWEWKESHFDYAAMERMMRDPPKPQPRFLEEVDKNGKKTKRQLPDQPVKQDI